MYCHHCELHAGGTNLSAEERTQRGKPKADTGKSTNELKGDGGERSGIRVVGSGLSIHARKLLGSSYSLTLALSHPVRRSAGCSRRPLRVHLGR